VVNAHATEDFSSSRTLVSIGHTFPLPPSLLCSDVGGAHRHVRSLPQSLRGNLQVPAGNSNTITIGQTPDWTDIATDHVMIQLLAAASKTP
jgi:hypothetical protein